MGEGGTDALIVSVEARVGELAMLTGAENVFTSAAAAALGMEIAGVLGRKRGWEEVQPAEQVCA